MSGIMEFIRPTNLYYKRFFFFFLNSRSSCRGLTKSGALLKCHCICEVFLPISVYLRISRCLRWTELARAVAKLAETSRKLFTSALGQSTSSVDVLICDSVVVRLEIEMFQRMKQYTYLYSMATVG